MVTHRRRGIEEHRAAMNALFESSMEAHARRPLPFSPPVPPLRAPAGQRDIPPLNEWPIVPASTDIEECLDGLRRLGKESAPQQRRFFRIVQARHHETGRPLAPRLAHTQGRRSAKTTSHMALAVGRCSNREDYHVAYSAQTGQKGRKRFLEVAQLLERYDPDPDHDRYRIFRSNGGERIEWTNGSSFSVLPPDAENYRGDEYDLVILDEAQEITDDDLADELLGGVMSTMDTRPGAQIIVAGTAGKLRSGLLWASLEKGRAHVWAILEYAAPETAAPCIIEPGREDDPHTKPPLNEETALIAHPGIGTLTTLDVIRERYDDLSLIDFQREYLGQWPEDATVSAIPTQLWKDNGTDLVERPARVGLAFDVAPDAAWASLCCAWRDEDGVAYIELLAHRAGVAWLAGEAYRVQRAAKGRLGYDQIGQNTNVADTLQRRRPAPRLDVLGQRDVQGSAQRLVTELAAGRLKHFRQKDMDLAAAGANWRRGTGDTARMFGHKASAHAITPLTAASFALWVYDRLPAQRRKRTLRTVADLEELTA